MVSVSEAEAVAHRMGFQYYETSAKTGEHVAQAFESAVKIGHTNKEKAAGRKRTKSKFAYWNSASPPPISECKHVLHDCISELDVDTLQY